MVAFHGTADPYISYAGGLGEKALALPTPDGSGTLGSAGVTGGMFPSVPDVAAKWAALDGCAATPPSAQPVASDVTLLTFTCPSGHEVALYRVDGGGPHLAGKPVQRLDRRHRRADDHVDLRQRRAVVLLRGTSPRRLRTAAGAALVRYGATP